MRTLIYVPIIYTGADLGSLAKDEAKRGVADLGTEAWREHQKTVEGFWYALSLYFNYGVDERRLKIYQAFFAKNLSSYSSHFPFYRR